MPSQPAREAAYAVQARAIRERVLAFAQARLAAGEYRDADLERFVRVVVPVVLAGRRQISFLTAAYLTGLLTELLGLPQRPPALPDTDALRGVAAALVYARPFVTARTALAGGATYTQASEQAVTRLASLVATDLQLARTTTAQAVLAAAPERVTGYRRVLRGDASCAMCVIASTQRYHRADLRPIHPGCDCDIEPLTGDSPHVIDQATLERAHQVIRERFGFTTRQGRDLGLGKKDAGGRPLPDFMDVLIEHRHGELGPVLGIRGQKFTGPNDI